MLIKHKVKRKQVLQITVHLNDNPPHLPAEPSSPRRLLTSSKQRQTNKRPNTTITINRENITTQYTLLRKLVQDQTVTIKEELKEDYHHLPNLVRTNTFQIHLNFKILYQNTKTLTNIFSLFIFPLKVLTTAHSLNFNI